MALTTTYSREEGAEDILNTYTSGTQSYNDVLALPNGGFVAAYNTDGGGFTLMDFYNAAGGHVTSHYGYAIPYLPVSPSDVQAVGEVSLALLANNNVVVIWNDTWSGDAGIRGAIYTQTGGVVSLEMDLATSAVFEDLDVAALQDGTFVVTYGSSAVDNLFFRIFNDMGAEVGALTTLNTSTTGIQRDAQVATLTDGSFVTTWTDEEGSGSTGDFIRGRIFNSDGSAKTDELTLATFGSNTDAAVAATKDGGFVIAYTDTGWFEDGISVQAFDANGASTFVVKRADEAAGADVKDVDVTVMQNGFIVVTWTQLYAAGDYDLKGAIFTATGEEVLFGSNNVFAIDGDVGTDEINSSVAALTGGKFVTGWQEEETTDIGTEINEIVRTTTGDDAADTFTGDELRDIISGGGGDDVINGGAGADVLTGGLGNDKMYVDNIGDTATEALNEGDDTVIASRSWAVASNIERVILSGSGDFNVAGNGLGNNLKGNSGDNWLNGSFGKDVLTGGGGRDSFIFNREIKSNNVDTITDYDVVRDVIRIDNAVFAGIGPAGALDTGAFANGAAATQADDRIIYDQATGRLYFDIDGVGGAAQELFATLSNKPTGMTAGEFIII